MPPPTRRRGRRADRRVEDADRAHARGADLVDGLRGDLLGDAGLDLRLARRDLALTGLEHLAHDDVLDLLGLDVRALERALDRGPAELRGVERCEPPPILPIGVRADPRMTVFGMTGIGSRVQ
jgi:hypothetical protein